MSNYADQYDKWKREGRIINEFGMKPVELSDVDGTRAQDGTARVTFDTTTTPTGSHMERKFLAMWQQLGGPVLDAEVRFHNRRRWRLDYCHIDTKTAIELEGGVFSQGRHTRGSGFVKDCEKYNAAQRLGYTVFRLATGMIQPRHIQPIIDHISEVAS